MERPGIYRSWQTEKSLAKFMKEHLANQAARREEELRELVVYAEGGNLYREPGGSNPAKPPFHFLVHSSLLCAIQDLDHATYLMFSRQNGWQDSLRKAGAYRYWSIRIDHHIHMARANDKWGVYFKFSVNQLIVCFYQGWLEQAQYLAKEILLLYRQKKFHSINNEVSFPLYHWFLRICFDHFDWAFDGWGKSIYGDPKQDIYAPGECFGDPVLNELFEHWRDEDLTPMGDHLIWLCDYYTHRTRRADDTEFGNDMLHTRFPELILAWFRLRQVRGLPIPRIDHPLMEPPYVYLPDPQPFYTDELLDRVLDRLRKEEIPNLGGMPSEEPLPPASQRNASSWWKRWFGS